MNQGSMAFSQIMNFASQDIFKNIVKQYNRNYKSKDFFKLETFLAGMFVYNWLSLKDKITEKRIDVFNANYSQFRGLTVTFYTLSIIVWVFMGWKLMLVPLTLGLLSNFRMFRFAKLYASEIFRTYLNYEEK